MTPSAPLTIHPEPVSTPAARCPACKAPGLSKRSDLVYETGSGTGRTVVGNLEGLTCGKCGRTWYTQASARLVKQYTGADRFQADYEVRLTRVGGNSIGLYLPKDLVRVLSLEAGMVGRAVPLEDGKFAVEFVRKDEEQATDQITDDLLIL